MQNSQSVAEITATMCPEQRDGVVLLGLKSIVSGTLTTCLLGAIVGVLS
ncbi:MAG: hypothetical protein WBD95_20135 [Xanthobacteraceae bacterium]